MEIELYLRSIMQEYPENSESEENSKSGGVKECWGNWKFDWGAERWRESELRRPERRNETEISGDQCLKEKLNLLKIRKEKFGALVYDPVSTAVFKVDKEGLEAIHLLRSGCKPEILSATLGVSQDITERFLCSLKRLSLW